MAALGGGVATPPKFAKKGPLRYTLKAYDKAHLSSRNETQAKTWECNRAARRLNTDKGTSMQLSKHEEVVDVETDANNSNVDDKTISIIETRLKLTPEIAAEAIRDLVNESCPDRLRITNVLKDERSNKCILFFKDADAPKEFWDDADGANMQVAFDCDEHVVHDAVHTILHSAPTVEDLEAAQFEQAIKV